MTKNEKIRQTLLQTKEKRKNQSCKVYSLKFDYSHLSKEKLVWLNKLFLETKWLYNYCLDQEDIFSIDYKLKKVSVLNKDKQFELRDLSNLSGQMKQSWQASWFGKQVQNTILGVTLSELKKHDKTIIVDRFSPTTKKCYMCGKINKISLTDRIYSCSCGLREDRDVKSAKTILYVGMDRIDVKPVEKKTSIRMLNYFNDFVSHASVKQEALVLSRSHNA